MTKKWLLAFIIMAAIPTALLIFRLYQNGNHTVVINPLGNLLPSPTPKPLERFTFENLKNTPGQESEINLDKIISETDDFTAYQFSFTTDTKKMTGQLNIPKTATPAAGFPIIFMNRGYVPLEIFETGVGTRNSAAVFARNGYATIAPDFLGYGGSDAPDSDSIAARLHHPLDVLNLLASLKNLPSVNEDKLFMWGHSNGGQISLSILQITGRPIPTVLWAPVSKSFPYSILYYTDDSPDQGKALRRAVASFEAEYDVFNYSIDRYFDWITAPVQIHQGTADDAIPLQWTNDLVKKLKDQELEVEYFIYPGADHDLRPDWNTAVLRSLDFYNRHL